MLTMEEIIEQFREKIRNTDFDGRQSIMNRFPSACCKQASMFFAKYLVGNNIVAKEDITFVVNALRDQSSHAWLEVNNRIVDISIDQFHETNQFTYELDSAFHQSFKGATRSSYHEVMSFNHHFERDFNYNYEKLTSA